MSPTFAPQSTATSASDNGIAKNWRRARSTGSLVGNRRLNTCLQRQRHHDIVALRAGCREPEASIDRDVARIVGACQRDQPAQAGPRSAELQQALHGLLSNALAKIVGGTDVL